MTEPRSEAPRVEISPGKGSEIVGLVFATAALVLGTSLATYAPDDPSFLHQSSASSVVVRNAIGRVGAELAAGGFGLLGPVGLAFPLILAVLAWKRLRPRARARVVGRGIGVGLLVVSAPPLLALFVPTLAWRGIEIASGGAFGALAAGGLAARMNSLGASLVFGALFLIGLVLAIQTSFGDLLARWNRRFRHFLDERRLARARRRERREKERARKRVVVKHIQMVAEEKQKQRLDALGRAARRDEGDASAPPAGARIGPGRAEAGSRIDLPLRRDAASSSPTTATAAASTPAAGPAPARVTVRRSASANAASGAPSAAAPRGEKQRDLGFPDGVSVENLLPPIDLLNLEEERSAVDETELVRLGEAIRARCEEFGVDGAVDGISPGPVITVFEFQPAPGVKVSQIVNLQDDLALALKAESIRIERIPGRSTLGIEVPNTKRSTIRLGPLIANEAFRRAPSLLTLALGRTIQGEPYYADLATMPHLLIAGATGSGKSIGLQSIITSMLYRATRAEIQFIFIDPKRIELGVYADIPHLKAEVVVEPKKAANALRWAVAEMERRYRLLAEVHVRSIDFYNRAIRDPEVRERLSLTEGDSGVKPSDVRPLPYYVIVIDELADLMMVAAAEVETSIARLAQMARAVGIHLILATQRPSVDILTGTIKANFPCRISFMTASRHDSRTILDQVGAEKLLGKGDMLYMPSGTSRTLRLHGPYISEQETAALVRWLKKTGRPELDSSVLEAPESEGGFGEGGPIDDDLFDEAARLVVRERMASASFLQRRMRVGFSRAARLIDIMEREGILGPQQGSKPRDVLVPPEYFEEVDRAHDD